MKRRNCHHGALTYRKSSVKPPWRLFISNTFKRGGGAAGGGGGLNRDWGLIQFCKKYSISSS